jgi:hypothetical protein
MTLASARPPAHVTPKRTTGYLASENIHVGMDRGEGELDIHAKPYRSLG